MNVSIGFPHEGANPAKAGHPRKRERLMVLHLGWRDLILLVCADLFSNLHTTALFECFIRLIFISKYTVFLVLSFHCDPQTQQHLIHNSKK